MSAAPGALALAAGGFFVLVVALMATCVAGGRRRLLDLVALPFLGGVALLFAYLVYGYRIGVLGE